MKFVNKIARKIGRELDLIPDEYWNIDGILIRKSRISKALDRALSENDAISIIKLANKDKGLSFEQANRLISYGLKLYQMQHYDPKFAEYVEDNWSEIANDTVDKMIERLEKKWSEMNK